jgi:hypothetical protein
MIRDVSKVNLTFQLIKKLFTRLEQRVEKNGRFSMIEDAVVAAVSHGVPRDMLPTLYKEPLSAPSLRFYRAAVEESASLNFTWNARCDSLRAWINPGAKKSTGDRDSRSYSHDI